MDKNLHFGYKFKKMMLESGMKVGLDEGLTDEEIQEVMDAQDVSQLPLKFRQYLEVLGNKGAFRGQTSSSWGYDFMLVLKKYLYESRTEAGVEDNDNFTAPADAFVFWGHGGYEYHYILTANHPVDSPVFIWSEEKGVYMYRNSIEDYFDWFLQQKAKLNNRTVE